MNGNRFTRSTHCKVHGSIALTEHEVAIIDHPLFQRQREIAQTGFLSLVYIGSGHTRFEHCIGVVQTMQKMLDALVLRSHASSEKLFPVENCPLDGAVNFDELPDPLKATIRQLSRICALVHDLGHGPLSHAFDRFAPTPDQVAVMLKDNRLTQLNRPYLVEALLQKTKDGRVHHEALSCIFFAVIQQEVKKPLPSWFVEAVSSVLLNVAGEGEIPAELHPWIPFIHDLISSAPIDADRMDYLLRDSRSAGVPYGEFHIDRVLKSILCIRKSEHTYGVAWRKSGDDAIAHFLYCRYLMFKEVYWHKTSRAGFLMLEAIANELMDAGISLFKEDTLDELIRVYLFYGDSIFMNVLSGKIPQHFTPSKNVMQIATDMHQRRLWKRVFGIQSNEALIAQQLEELKRLYPDEDFIVDRRPIKITADLAAGTCLVRVDHNRKYAKTISSQEWLKSSPILRALTEEERGKVAIYVKKHVDQETLEHMKKSASAFASGRI